MIMCSWAGRNKKTLSVAVYNHYKKSSPRMKSQPKDDVEIQKAIFYF